LFSDPFENWKSTKMQIKMKTFILAWQLLILLNPMKSCNWNSLFIRTKKLLNPGFNINLEVTLILIWKKLRELKSN
jgi:hypothetical protein